ncbi:MAG: type II toxin-antitoxin system death-on-curing family toxin [Acidobacteriota bacterium]|nr:type II toxin-antitoxin system death-on-curing family toxin [Blastocatellia bacterium]MDQ3491344.1 type II toxin-antitoxin system death-on-curing family toxin [Acidobacteriota bacterium]
MPIDWIAYNSVLAMHKRQIAEHGGTDGLRDEGLLLSALARPENLEAYGENVDLAALAASYAFGIAKNHPFLDGNKRTALVVAVTFLNLNGYDFDASSEETYTMFLGLAEGSISKDDLAVWFRNQLRQLS